MKCSPGSYPYWRESDVPFTGFIRYPMNFSLGWCDIDSILMHNSLGLIYERVNTDATFTGFTQAIYALSEWFTGFVLIKVQYSLGWYIIWWMIHWVGAIFIRYSSGLYQIIALFGATFTGLVTFTDEQFTGFVSSCYFRWCNIHRVCTITYTKFTGFTRIFTAYFTGFRYNFIGFSNKRVKVFTGFRRNMI